MHGEDAARVFEEIASLMAFRGQSPFKIRAYENAARTLRGLDTPLETLVAERRLEDLPGVGKAIAQKIRDFVATGRVPLHDRLTSETPVGVLELLRVPGVGPKRARAAFETLGIDSLGALEAAARDGSLAQVAGFGERMAAKVLESVDRVRTYHEQVLGVDAFEVGQLLCARLAALDEVNDVEVAGPVRRRMETAHEITLVAAGRGAGTIEQAWIALEAVVEVVEREDRCVTVRLHGDVRATLHVVEPQAFPFALAAQTGSGGHWTRLVERAGSKGLALSSEGLLDAAGEPVACADEAALYAALDLAWVPPELREDRGEVEAAAAGPLPRLIAPDDVRGAVHCHSSWSDGRASIGVMARAATDHGYEYVVICDHSRSAGYAGGLDVDDLARQRDEIERLNAEGGGAEILTGIEVDILKDGRLDLPDETLAGLECVVASIHSHLGLSRAEQTARVCRALAHPHVDVLGHPSSRLLLRRPPCSLDMERVLDAAAEHRVAIEINGQPRRLDLDWRWHRQAIEHGIDLVVTPDAHGPESIGYVDHAVGAARKGGVGPEDVLNTRSSSAFRKALGSSG